MAPKKEKNLYKYTVEQQWRQQTIRIKFTHLFCAQTFSRCCCCYCVTLIGHLLAGAVGPQTILNCFSLPLCSGVWQKEKNMQKLCLPHRRRGQECRGIAALARLLRGNCTWIRVTPTRTVYPLHFVCMHISFKLYFLLVWVCVVVVASRAACWYMMFFSIFRRWSQATFVLLSSSCSLFGSLTHVCLWSFKLYICAFCSSSVRCFCADHAHSNNADEHLLLFSVK